MHRDLTQTGTSARRRSPLHRGLTLSILVLGWSVSVATSYVGTEVTTSAATTVQSGEALFVLDIGGYLLQAPACFARSYNEARACGSQSPDTPPPVPLIIESPRGTLTDCEVGGRPCDLADLCGSLVEPCELAVTVSVPELEDGETFILAAQVDLGDRDPPGRLELRAAP